MPTLTASIITHLSKIVQEEGTDFSSDRENPFTFSNLGSLKSSDWKILYRAWASIPYGVEAKDLELASGLSRSACLNRADKIAKMGILVKKVKPGTENRNYPPYVFSIPKEYQQILRRLLESDEIQTIINPNGDKKSNSFGVSRTHSEESSDLMITRDEEDQENPSENEKISEVNESFSSDMESSSSQSRKRATEHEVLKKLAEEIVLLKQRISQLEQKIEDQSQEPSPNNTLEEVLNFLESSS